MEFTCPNCKKYYKKATLLRSGGICFRCIKKQSIIKGKCSLCEFEQNIETLNKRGGICITCYTRNINNKRENCKKCGKEFSHLTLSNNNGYCTPCKYSKSLPTLDELSTIINDYSNENKEQENKDKLITLKFERINQPYCVICLEKWNDNDDIIILQDCKHYFHSICINQWLINKKECPICKTIINFKDH